MKLVQILFHKTKGMGQQEGTYAISPSKHL